MTGLSSVACSHGAGNAECRSWPTRRSAAKAPSCCAHPTLGRIGAERGCSAATVALAWAIRGGDVIAIPQSGSVAHVKENAVALSLTLTPQDLQALDAAFPPGGR